jgi:hypothetical protein
VYYLPPFNHLRKRTVLFLRVQNLVRLRHVQGVHSRGFDLGFLGDVDQDLEGVFAAHLAHLFLLGLGENGLIGQVDWDHFFIAIGIVVRLVTLVLLR